MDVETLTTITKRFRFEAAHRLEDWPQDHKCHQLHGHSYVLEISLVGGVPDAGRKPGAIIDFAEVGSIVKDLIIRRWDHKYLNEILGIRNTTAEVLVRRIFNLLYPALGSMITRVRLNETQDGWADYYVKH